MISPGELRRSSSHHGLYVSIGVASRDSQVKCIRVFNTGYSGASIMNVYDIHDSVFAERKLCWSAERS